MILKWILGPQAVKIYSAVNQLRIQFDIGLMQTLQRTFGFHKKRDFLISERLSASQQVLSFQGGS